MFTVYRFYLNSTRNSEGAVDVILEVHNVSDMAVKY